ncbi:MAG: hypothetical protein R2823_00005, partial [Acidimicrobiia bacterium]
QQLRAEHYKVVVVNGRTALRWVSRAGLTKWHDLARLTGPPTATVCVGDTSSPLFVGWSCNLQSQPGAMRHADDIAGIVRTVTRKKRNHRRNSTVGTDTSLPRGAHARTGTELISLLATWLAKSSDQTIGDVSRFPRAPWISVETPLGLMDLNADTRRSAVSAFLDHVRQFEGAVELHVVANRRGRINKVVFDPAKPSPIGWYAYLRTARPASTSMTLP